METANSHSHHGLKELSEFLATQRPLDPGGTGRQGEGGPEASCGALSTITTSMAVTTAGDTCSLGVTPGSSTLIAYTPHFPHSLAGALFPVLPFSGGVTLGKSLPLSEPHFPLL